MVILIRNKFWSHKQEYIMCYYDTTMMWIILLFSIVFCLFKFHDHFLSLVLDHLFFLLLILLVQYISDISRGHCMLCYNDCLSVYVWRPVGLIIILFTVLCVYRVASIDSYGRSWAFLVFDALAEKKKQNNYIVLDPPFWSLEKAVCTLTLSATGSRQYCLWFHQLLVHKILTRRTKWLDQ